MDCFPVSYFSVIITIAHNNDAGVSQSAIALLLELSSIFINIAAFYTYTEKTPHEEKKRPLYGAKGLHRENKGLQHGEKALHKENKGPM